MRFHDRREAGVALARRLEGYGGRQDVLLFALPRGGVVLGAEVAEHLHLPLDVIITRKIGAPSNEEFAVGAVSETGEVIWNSLLVDLENHAELREILLKEVNEINRRRELYREGRRLPDMSGKVALIIDDGVATGYTAMAAITAARERNAAQVVVAVPHGAPDSLAQLRSMAEVVALDEPHGYGAVGQFYDEFYPISDREVIELLQSSR